MGLTEGRNTCPNCGKEFTARFVKFPENDIRHPIGCPYCDATVGYASGTDDIITSKITSSSSPTCPVCDSNMITRENSRTGQNFWGCVNYPACKGTRPYTNNND